MRHVPEQERHVDHVDIVDDRPQGSCADAQKLDCADLGLLDGLFLPAKLHGWIHPDREPSVCSRHKLPSEALGRRDGGITGRLNVGSLEHRLHLRPGWQGDAGRQARSKSKAQLHEMAAFHPSASWRIPVVWSGYRLSDYP